MLRLAGYLNILIAVAHVVGLLWAEKMFEVTGIGNDMKQLALKHYSLPYLVTIVVAIVFFIFGLYALAADGRFKKLPFQKPGVYAIGIIFLIRGIGEFIFDSYQDTNQSLETLYSLIAIAIGLLFLIGQWRKSKNQTL